MDHIYPHPDWRAYVTGPECLFPSPEVDLYPALSGPPAWYPAEPKVHPAWAGDGRAAYDPAVMARIAKVSSDHAPYPEPEVTSTWTAENWEEEWYPRAPRGFMAKARAAGWDVRIGFSRGSIPGAKANTYQTRDMIGVWLDGFGKRAGVFWERNPDAVFSAKKLEASPKPGEIPSGMMWTTKGGSIRFGPGMAFPYPNLTEMEEWVALRGEVLPSWYVACQKRVMDAAAKASGAEPAESTV